MLEKLADFNGGVDENKVKHGLCGLFFTAFAVSGPAIVDLLAKTKVRLFLNRIG